MPSLFVVLSEILLGYKTWKQVEENQGGKVSLNLDKAAITYVGMA